MENFKQIDPAEITDNFIRAIGREWMLVTAGNRESCNTMTASWGLIGFIWGRPVAQFVIRPQRYTREFVDREERATLSFFSPEYRAALEYCGSRTGRTEDKIRNAASSMSEESGPKGSSIAVAIRNGIPSTIITRSILPKSSELTCGSKLSRDRSRR